MPVTHAADTSWLSSVALAGPGANDIDTFSQSQYTVTSNPEIIIIHVHVCCKHFQMHPRCVLRETNYSEILLSHTDTHTQTNAR